MRPVSTSLSLKPLASSAPGQLPATALEGVSSCDAASAVSKGKQSIAKRVMKSSQDLGIVNEGILRNLSQGTK